VIRDLIAIVWTLGGFWLLRHDLFEREPHDRQAAELHPSSNLHVGVGPGEDAPSRSETFPIDPAASWSADAVERTLAEIASL
jgi:hypothetical protein